MVYTYKPRGVCSKEMKVEIQDGILVNLEVEGGCNGNLKGISSLVKGMPVDQVIDRLSGIRCKFRLTSCPDQLTKALKRAMKEQNEG